MTIFVLGARGFRAAQMALGYDLEGRMPVDPTLSPARELAATNAAHFPNESAKYRTARNELLAEEIELRRHIERVAAQRHALPLGGEVPQDFELVSETGPIPFSRLFGDEDTLLVYSMMYGPARQAPCPVCTSFLSSWNGAAVNLRERVAIAVTARSPIDRLLDYKKPARLRESPLRLGHVRRVHTRLRQSG
jgi:predicted dithiol-disulfide oxidoreductase (DUF899 family)